MNEEFDEVSIDLNLGDLEVNRTLFEAIRKLWNQPVFARLST